MCGAHVRSVPVARPLDVGTGQGHPVFPIGRGQGRRPLSVSGREDAGVVKTFSSSTANSREPSAAWVESMGGPLIAVPVSAPAQWRGCMESGMVIGDRDDLDD
jgi:hypothetical protein